MPNIAGTNLKEPDFLNWDGYDVGVSTYRRPPEPVGPDGKFVTFYAQVPKEITMDETDDGYRRYVMDFVLVKSGSADGIKFRDWLDVRKFPGRDGKVKEASSVGNFLRAAGLTSKPQKNVEYDAAVNLTRGRVVPLTIDWRARSTETGEEIYGYSNFPDDPERPGKKKAILRAGDIYTVRDKTGAVIETKVVKAEVLFANARRRYFIDPARRKANG